MLCILLQLLQPLLIFCVVGIQGGLVLKVNLPEVRQLALQVVELNLVRGGVQLFKWLSL